ncbi:MAG: DUF3429 domain-containing protein [Chitinophagales bacterium]|nr:DUF3429 domain-containing protein [Hyphomicrobiales bacterium]
MDRTRRLYAALTYLGTLPFISSALLMAFDIANIPYLGAPMEVARSYGLVIVSFMAGAHWGQQIALKAATPINLHITSVFISLCAWISHLLLPHGAFMLVLIVLFAGLLVIDVRLHRYGVIDRHYLETRCGVTGIVITALLVTTLSA